MTDNPDFCQRSNMNACVEIDKSSSEAMGRDKATKCQKVW